MINTQNPSYRQIYKPIMALLLCASTVSVQAAIISDNSERRIQIRPSGSANSSANSSTNSSSNVYIRPATTTASNDSSGVTILSGTKLSGANTTNGDSMQALIAQKQRDFVLDGRLSIEENKKINVNQRAPVYHTTYSNNRYGTTSNTYNGAATDVSNMDFNAWLNSNSYRAQQVAEYQRYLITSVGAQNVPPLSQLLTTARSWNKCGHEPYQLPPQELWANIVPTLRLYSELKHQGVLPISSEIRSVYRSPDLNSCAGGANNSKHTNGSAIDIWVPEYENNIWRLSIMQDSLCQFWQYQGEAHNFGLGLYSTGAIHLDTDGYRKWGFNHASSSSACRY